VSQVAAKRKLVIRNERVLVKAHFHEQGSVLRGDAEGFCDGFEIEIHIDSEETSDKIAELVRLARRMCFTEKALMGSTPVTVTQTLNERPLEI
jgi:organic hydroperoxide reductase OsmC/OhrA